MIHGTLTENLGAPGAEAERRAARLTVEPLGVDDAWDFHRRHAELTTPFTRPDFADLLSAAYRRPLLRLGVVGAAGLEAVVQIPVRRRAWLATAPQVPFPYVGLMTDSRDHLPSQILAIRRALSRARVGFAVLSLPPQLAMAAAGLSGAGVYVHERTTCILATDAQSVEATAARWGRSVHRAMRAGLRIEAATAAEMSGVLGQLTSRVLLRSSSMAPEYPGPLFPLAWEALQGDADFLARVAHAGHDVVGLMVSLRQGRTLYADGIAERPEILGVLLLDLARVAAERGCTACDVTGGPPRVVAFKQRWGASLSSYADVHLRDPLLGAALDGWRRARRLGRLHRRPEAPSWPRPAG